MHLDLARGFALRPQDFELFIVLFAIRSVLMAIVRLKKAVWAGWTYILRPQLRKPVESIEMGSGKAFIALFLPSIFFFHGIDDLQQQRELFVQFPRSLKPHGCFLPQVILNNRWAHLWGSDDNISQSHILLGKMRRPSPNPYQQPNSHIPKCPMDAPHDLCNGNFPIRSSGWSSNGNVMLPYTTQRILILVFLHLWDRLVLFIQHGGDGIHLERLHVDEPEGVGVGGKKLSGGHVACKIVVLCRIIGT